MMKQLAAILMILALAGAADGRGRRHSAKPSGGAPGVFDYYLLSLSWAPDFCARTDVQPNSRECGTGNHMGFVVHGLWPQFENGSYPKQCAPASPVAGDIVTAMLPYMPDAGLIQHEWRDHGTCSGLPSAAYFGQVRKAFQSLQIPAPYRNLNKAVRVTPNDIESQFAAANAAYPKEAFRVSCGAGQLNEVRVCLTKDLKVRACPASERDCPSVPLVMLPER